MPDAWTRDMAKQTLIQAMMAAHEARANCERTGNMESALKHRARFYNLTKLLPSGAGIDNGTEVVDVTGARLKLACSFHHMNDAGYYTEWTSHTIRVVPDWVGVKITITGPDRNSIKDHLHEVYYTALTANVEYVESPDPAAVDGYYRFVRES